LGNLILKTKKTLIFTATYNERENIKLFLDRIWKAYPEFNVLVVDDNSPDGTGALLDEMSKECKRLMVVHRPQKLGLGTAHHLAMLFAIRNDYDVLITMDADLSHDPGEIPVLITALEKSDFVIGSRYMPGGLCNYSGYRLWVSKTANSAARALLGIKLNEFTTSFRAFRVAKLAKVNFLKMHNNGYSFFMESLYRFSQSGFRMVEVPIRFQDRYSGVSKIPKLEIFRGAIKLIHLSLSRLARRPIGVSDNMLLDQCGGCGESFLSVKFPAENNSVIATQRSDDFRCSSMAHDRKPMVAICMKCGLSQVPNSEQTEDLESIYADVVDQTYLDNIKIREKTFKNIYGVISPYLPKPGTLLEVGSYCGLFLQEAIQHGWKVQGVEPSRWASNYSINESKVPLNIINSGFYEAAPTLRKDFDLLISWDVLEHVQNPKNFIEISSVCLKKGGVFIFSTVDIDSLFARIMGRRWPWIMEMHLYYFGSGSLERMVEGAGFEILKVGAYPHYTSLPYAYQKFYSNFSGFLGSALKNLDFLVPRITAPICLGDVKYYICRKI